MHIQADSGSSIITIELNLRIVTLNTAAEPDICSHLSVLRCAYVEPITCLTTPEVKLSLCFF
jgi:hypothetical protein